MQRHWIGKSEGVEVDFKIDRRRRVLHLTRPVLRLSMVSHSWFLAPDGQLSSRSLCREFRTRKRLKLTSQRLLKKNDMDCTELNKTKSGCRCSKGIYAVNPVNRQAGFLYS